MISHLQHVSLLSKLIAKPWLNRHCHISPNPEGSNASKFVCDRWLLKCITSHPECIWSHFVYTNTHMGHLHSVNCTFSLLRICSHTGNDHIIRWQSTCWFVSYIALDYWSDMDITVSFHQQTWLLKRGHLHVDAYTLAWTLYMHSLHMYLQWSEAVVKSYWWDGAIYHSPPTLNAVSRDAQMPLHSALPAIWLLFALEHLKQFHLHFSSQSYCFHNYFTSRSRHFAQASSSTHRCPS